MAEDISYDDIVARVRAIKDPAAKARARATLLRMASGASGGAGADIDLAARLPVRPFGNVTGDGRRSFKRQGKWGHGFVPLDEKAKESKAKGSPIARKRIERVFDKRRNKASKPSEMLVIKNDIGGTEKVQSASKLRNPEMSKTRRSQRAEDPDKEKSLGGQIRRRSDKRWQDIPDAQKVTRNGQRFVLTTFRGKQQLTQHFGPTDTFVEGVDSRDRVFRSVTAGDAMNMSTAELRQLLRNPGQPDHVKKVLRAALEKKYLASRTRG